MDILYAILASPSPPPVPRIPQEAPLPHSRGTGEGNQNKSDPSTKAYAQRISGEQIQEGNQGNQARIVNVSGGTPRRSSRLAPEKTPATRGLLGHDGVPRTSTRPIVEQTTAAGTKRKQLAKAPQTSAAAPIKRTKVVHATGEGQDTDGQDTGGNRSDKVCENCHSGSASLSENGVYTTFSYTEPDDRSRDDCHKLTTGRCKPPPLLQPTSSIEKVVENAHGTNRDEIRRNITLWAVPSAESLLSAGVKISKCIGGSYLTRWTLCETMGWSQPEPDYVAGFGRDAFTKSELEKLDNHTTPQGPFFVTDGIAFPFLICEVREEGTAVAERRNAHSGAIAVRAIRELFRLAYGENSDEMRALDKRVLVFSVAHDCSRAVMDGHFSSLEESSDRAKYQTYGIDDCHFTRGGGKFRYKSFNFVRRVYMDHAPQLLNDIKAAIAKLPDVAP